MGILNRLWPGRSQVEHRADVSERTIAALLGNATDGPAPEGVGAISSAAGLWSRAVSSAEVQPDGLQAVLTRDVLSAIGGGIVLRGDVLFLIDLDRFGRLRLTQAASWDVGEASDGSYVYAAEVAIAGKNHATRRRIVGEQGVLRFTWATDPKRPWAGVGPLSGITGQLAERLELSLTRDASITTGMVMPQPDGVSKTAIAQIKGALQLGKGKMTLVETQVQGFGQGREAAPAAEWKQVRYGPEIPNSNITLRGAVADSIFQACGIPLGLTRSSGAAATRDSYRQFVAVAVQPIVHRLEAELTAKLGQPVTLDLGELAKPDLVSRTRAAGSLSQAGFSKEEIVKIVGFSL